MTRVLLVTKGALWLDTSLYHPTPPIELGNDETLSTGEESLRAGELVRKEPLLDPVTQYKYTRWADSRKEHGGGPRRLIEPASEGGIMVTPMALCIAPREFGQASSGALSSSCHVLGLLSSIHMCVQCGS